MSQVFVVTAAGSVIAFIIRDMGESALSGWIIQVRSPHPQPNPHRPSSTSHR